MPKKKQTKGKGFMSILLWIMIIMLFSVVYEVLNINLLIITNILLAGLMIMTYGGGKK